MANSSTVDQTRHHIRAEGSGFDLSKEIFSKPLRTKRGKKSKLGSSSDVTIADATSILYQRLQASLLNHGNQNTTEIASLLSALSLAEIAFPKSVSSRVDASAKETVTHVPVSSESVVDYPENANLSRFDAVDAFRWRRDLEVLWKKHISKDEFHQPVVRSLGVPVMTIVNHIRDGSSWDAIRKLYPGLVMDDIRACASMATECGWLSDD